MDMIKLQKLMEHFEIDSEDTAGICVIYGKKLLACKRTESYWSIPKGHIHINEVPLDGALREFTEETQVMLNGVPELVSTTNKKSGKFYLYKYETDKRINPHLDHEHEEWGYFEVDKLPQPFDEKVLNELQKVIGDIK